jgi:protein-S-isoprenylcysteine O-methyltransferase Ste14
LSHEKIQGERPTIAVEIGGKRLSGAAAAIAVIVFLALIVGLVVVLEPRFAWSPLWISAAMWIGFMIYWGVAARESSRIQDSETLSSRRLHQNLLNLALVLLFLRLPGLKTRWTPDLPFFIESGLMLQAASIGLAVWARRHLGRHWSGAIARKVDHELVRTGPYRFVRHPIYGAMLGMYLGTALVSGELHAMIAVAIVAVAYGRKIRLEENLLRDVFGREYDDYRGRSWALFPGVY